jgi:glycosyltransferase involved in cell wall biosynthesis
MAATVSIVLATHNGSRLISKAISSVAGQTYPHWELIVVDDGSTDGTQELVAELATTDRRIICVRSERCLGLYEALDVGIRAAKGGLIARIDDDDEWICPDKLSEQLRLLASDPACVLVGTNMVAVDDVGNEIGHFTFPQRDCDIRETLLLRNCFVHSSVLFRKEAWASAGGYSECQGMAADYDLWLRMGCQGNLANLPGYCIRYRLRRESMSARAVASTLAAMRVVRRHRGHYPHYTWSVFRRSLALAKNVGLGWMPFGTRLQLRRWKHAAGRKIRSVGK